VIANFCEDVHIGKINTRLTVEAIERVELSQGELCTRCRLDPLISHTIGSRQVAENLPVLAFESQSACLGFFFTIRLS
jgi:hypothetical protein